jgi:transposase
MAGTRKDLMDIRDLIRRLQASPNDSRIQRDTGINRRTIRRYRQWAAEHGLLTGPLPSLEALAQLVQTTLTAPPPPQTRSSLEPYREFILALHAQDVEGAAIWQRLKETYQVTASLSAVYRLLQHHAPATSTATVRVETPPGVEAQVDFGFAGRLRDPETGTLRKAWLFVMTLSHSRHQYVEFVWDQSIATWLTAHQHAFAFFGGVPTRIVIDNLKAAITKACVDDPQVQLAYRECAEHYGFLIAPCRPRTPEHKGKVEQGGVHYVKRNFLGGRTPTTIAEANTQVRDWCQTTAGLRIHGTTKQQPLHQFTAVEQATLQPLPRTAYDLAQWKVATVHRDCYVVFDNAFYSVPFRLIGHTVRVRGGSREIRLYTDDWQLVATHPRASQPGERQTLPDHLPPDKVPGLLAGHASYREQAASIGTATAQVVETLFADQTIDRLRTVGRILRLAERYGAARLEAACARALTFAEPTHRTIKQILVQGLDQTAPEPATPKPAHTFVRTAAELLGHLFGGLSWN